MLELADDIREGNVNTSYTSYAFDDTCKLQEKELHQLTIDDFIEENYNKPVTIASLSEIMHLSTKQTERIFARELNTSFREHLIKKRIEVAMNHLQKTDLSANEIARRVGYNSYDGFYRTFSSRVGMSPQEYRKKTKKQDEKV